VVDPPSRYLELMRLVSFVLGCAVLALAGCNGGGQSASQPTVGSTQAALISYDEAMQRPVAIGDATKKCRERQLSGDQVVAELDRHLDEMYHQCVVSESRRGNVPSTVISRSLETAPCRARRSPPEASACRAASETSWKR
jgi:hypothetical protein